MGRARQEAAQRQRVIGVVVISALLALGLLVWLPFQGQDAQYIEQCLAEWGTAHSDTDQDMNMDPSNCPKEMPPALRDAYTLNGQIDVMLEFKCQTGPAYQKKHHYSQEQIDSTIANVQKGLGNYYGVLDRLLYKALEEFPLHMKDVIVLGSQRLRFLTVADYDKNSELFEVAISLSSFEHDGLGR
ncbi:uncharacterized protein ACA1_263930 [Acanthamoeba castellanii str. Neff]|uniref:Uncharacterized protein n=1 Tax=Acanthamoeba castellanii (strain ATCC 30010 / Neff) TaxID=1257118 RepID=L8H3D4_ACACF|nr:uncharacterized protein ACA1_263930 [Acanthamoeba castellanii str. Neff]ELR19223.1 hypothetical protein ACA1_263930 [Acanthamoeba castellanii str. Neff]